MTTVRGQTALFAVAMTATTAAGHVAGHGSVAGLAWVLPMLAIAYLARASLGSRICSWRVCAAVCAALQLGGHLLLRRVAENGSPAPLGDPGICGDNLMPGGSGTPTAGHLSQLPLTTGHSGQVPAAMLGAHGLAMLAAHLVVALAAAWWLHSGELVAAALAAWVTSRLLVPTVRKLPAIAVRGGCPARVVRRLATRPLVCDAPGRAPPLAWV